MVKWLLTRLHVEPRVPAGPLLEQRGGKAADNAVHSEREHILSPAFLKDSAAGVHMEQLRNTPVSP